MLTDYTSNAEFRFDRNGDPGENANLIWCEVAIARRLAARVDTHVAEQEKSGVELGVLIIRSIAERLRAMGYLRWGINRASVETASFKCGWNNFSAFCRSARAERCVHGAGASADVGARFRTSLLHTGTYPIPAARAIHDPCDGTVVASA